MNFKFSFSSVTRDEDETENKLLDASKSRPFIDILTKIVKYNQYISPNVITRSFNSETSTSRFPTAIKNTKVEAQFLKTIQGLIKQFIIGQSVCYQ